MAKHSPQDIRNIALIGHADSGKTTLVDTILKVTGTVNRLGSVNDGTSASDFDDEERDRKNSIYAAVLHAAWKNKQIHIIDTPGYPDFIGEVITALAAADIAVLCVSAVNGVAVNTRRTWTLAENYKLPRAILITKIDSDSAKYDEVLEQVQEVFGRTCRPVMIPVGSGPSVSGVTNLLAGEGEGRMGALFKVLAVSGKPVRITPFDPQAA